MTDRRGSARSGHSYKDPIYDGYEAELEKKYGLPQGGMGRIRTRGERSNADQVSPVGARTVYQIMPATRALFKKTYGVDAYSSPQAAAEVAALHLRDDLKKTGSWTEAVRRYIGGPDPSQHGSQTRAYVQRVTGIKDATVTHENGAVSLKPGVSLSDFSVDEILNTAPNDLGNTRRPLGPQRKAPTVKDQVKDAKLDALIKGGSVTSGDTTTDLTSERQAATADRIVATEQKRMADEYGFMDRLESSWGDWLGTAMIEALSEQPSDVDPNWVKGYANNFAALEETARTSDEVSERRASVSEADYHVIVKRQQQEADRNAIIDSNGTGWMFRLGAGFTDPVGWAAGAGTAKAFQVGGVGATQLAQAGKTGAAVASLAGESALGNVAATSILDMAGKDQHVEDYGLSALFGATIGVAMSPLVLRGHNSAALAQHLDDMAGQSRAAAEAQRATAVANVGPNATPAQVNAEVDRLRLDEQQKFFELSLADVGEDMKLLSPDGNLTESKAVAGGVDQRHNVSGQVSDVAEAGVVSEHIARAEAFEANNPIDKKGLKTILAKGGMESTGLRLLNSDSVVARTIGQLLLEGTTGAGGRRRTAAMSQVVRERLYNRHMITFDELATMHRNETGGSIFRDLWDGSHRREFNRRVFLEIEKRGTTPHGSFDSSPAVVRAADDFERGMDAMRVEMQHVDAVGASRLGTSSRGYLPHRLDAAKVVRLSENRAQMSKVQAVLQRQFQDPANGFIVVTKDKITGEVDKLAKNMDADFAKKLSIKYLERALLLAKGGHDVPMNLHSPEAADIVRDSLTAMNLGAEAVEEMMGKYSRGGAGFTKKRLRLDLSEDIGEGMVLGDLFNQDISGLYRSYARRVSGEVALAQYGIMGKKGLMLLRRAMEVSGADPKKDMEAFDQIAAEFLNTPFGSWNHQSMDNIRIATSAARLGGMGITQFGEYGNAIAHVGVVRTLSAIGGFNRLRKEVGMLAKGGVAKNPILDSVDQLGGHIGLDDYNLTRMFDVKDNDIQMYGQERMGIMTRAIRATGHLQTIMSAHRITTAVQTRGMAEQIIRKAVKFAKAGTDDIHLDDMGINADLRAALRRNMDKIATFRGDKLETLDLMAGDLTGPELMGIRDAIERGASQIIQRTYTGETGKWAHNGFLKMLLQFRTFSVTSVEKQWGRNYLKGGAGMWGAVKAFATLVGAMSFATPIQLARIHSKTVGMSRSERDEYISKNASPAALARATLNYASAAGLAGDVLDIGSGFANSFGGDGGEAIADSINVRGKGQKQLVGGVVAPGVGLLQDVYTGIGASGNGGSAKKLAKSLPGSNLPFVSPLITGLTAD